MGARVATGSLGAAMAPLLILLFIVLPIVELYALIQVGQSIGVLPTIGLLILDSIVGAFLLRREGRSAWLRFNDAVRSGRVPARETLDGGLVILGGALLMTPGFVTDIFGLVMLVPPTRAVVRRFALPWLGRRMVVAAAVRATPRAAPTRAPGGRDADIDGTATEVDTPTPHLPQ